MADLCRSMNPSSRLTPIPAPIKVVRPIGSLVSGQMAKLDCSGGESHPSHPWRAMDDVDAARVPCGQRERGMILPSAPG
jgi:hypothetical protein